MSKTTTALHEILAVETGLAETANRIQKETTKTLEQKRTIFTGLLKAHKLFAEEDQHKTQANDVKEVESTVKEQIDYASNEIGRYWDSIFKKEEANQRAKADIIIDGAVIAEGIPSIVLLSMEKKLSSLIGMYNAIPTLDASRAWEPDTTYPKANIFRSKHDKETQQSVTVREFKEISPATKEFKAQLAEVSDVKVVGKFIQTDYSGMLTSLDKAEKLQRLTALIRAVKQARQRANATTVNQELQFGRAILDYING